MSTFLAADGRNWRSLHLTGGPCSGKTTAQAHLQEICAAHGIRTLFVPEAATILITGGISDFVQIAQERPDLYQQIQAKGIIGLVRAMRAQYLELAAAFAPEPVLVVFDRAELDSRAYMGDEAFFAACQQIGLTVPELWSYDAVVHMVTAAQGAQEHYTTANNAARSETPQQARDLDARTLAAVTGHPHLRIADNRSGFQAKLDRVAAVALGLFGIPEPVEDERKFLLGAAPDLADARLSDAVSVDIEQTYLAGSVDGIEERVRRRTWRGQSAYTHTVKDRRVAGPPIERERLISRKEYQRLLGQADPARRTLRKTRTCFAYGASYCELDRVQLDDGDVLWLLEIERVTPDEPLELPDFLDIAREVTGEPAYLMSHVAARP